jgi:transposase
MDLRGTQYDLENHVRGLLKNLGLVIGRAKFNVFAVRAEELIEGRPELIAAIRPLLEARNAVGQQVSELDRKVMKLARHDAQVRRFMTVPGAVRSPRSPSRQRLTIGHGLRGREA